MALPMIAGGYAIGAVATSLLVGIGSTLLVVRNDRLRVKDAREKVELLRCELAAERAAYRGERLALQQAAYQMPVVASSAMPAVSLAKQVEDSLRAKFRLQPKE